MAARVPRGGGRDRDDHRPRLTSDQIGAINRFPDDNPNPVMRVDADGRLSYANPASDPITTTMGIAVGDRLPANVDKQVEEAAGKRAYFEIECDHRTFALWPVPIRDLGFTNVYGMDVTAERAIVKFPDANPHPVFRLTRDGTLLYANPASAALVEGIGGALGQPLPGSLSDALLEHASVADRGTVEVEAGGAVYSLLAVDVREFDFVNVYGTDITAQRERERLARENERLLLNILPEPIARRLRDGERLIADRFDDVTLMFADVVEFTRLSSSMSPSELVGVLNQTFLAFDELVDRHGLEKVKTIGDAYMVVGGMPHRSDDHTSRVAAMALDLAHAVGHIEAARRLGIQFRIGLHCGPVVAGVIGSRKFIYDVWGDTVNLASRMESLGVPGRIQVTEAVMERLRNEYEFESRGVVDVKGKGLLATYFLIGRTGTRGPATLG